jgi:Uma2 family endonuclease
MLLDVKTRLMTPTEYLAMERASEYRHEYYQGEITDMTGASRRHNLIVGSIYARLYMQLLGRPCEIYANDMRVKVTPAGLYTYPDIVVVSGKPHFEDDQFDTLLNPTVIIKVLSDSTEEYDRGKKFARYRKLDSLLDYLLIAKDRMHVEQFTRQQNDTWLFSETEQPTAVIRLASIDSELRLETIYEKVTLSA